MQRFWYTRMITKADQGLLDELFKGVKNKEEEALNTFKALEEREAELAKIETEALKVSTFSQDSHHSKSSLRGR
jgi:SWI/SNF-related matrix-associated actin-dependent regulator of chromatin subfamily A member 5